MKILKYLILFAICFLLGQYLLRLYYTSKKDTNKPSNIKNIKKENLTRISSPLLIDKGKIESNIIEGEFDVENIGEFDLTRLEVSGDCSCTDIKFNKKDFLKRGISTVYYKIDLSKDNGWFSKTIKIEGSFFPRNRLIKVEGYKL